MANMQADAISLVNRNAMGVFVNVGDQIRIVITTDYEEMGYSAYLSKMPAIKFKESDYELCEPDKHPDMARTYNTPMNVVSLVERCGFGVKVEVGDRIKVLAADDGTAVLASLPAIWFGKDDYEEITNMESIRIELLERKATKNRVYAKGDLFDATILPNGSAQLKCNTLVVLQPHQYKIYVSEKEFDKLLRSS